MRVREITLNHRKIHVLDFHIFCRVFGVFTRRDLFNHLRCVKKKCNSFASYGFTWVRKLNCLIFLDVCYSVCHISHIFHIIFILNLGVDRVSLLFNIYLPSLHVPLRGAVCICLRVVVTSPDCFGMKPNPTLGLPQHPCSA